MDLQLLATFVAVATERSFSGAAKKLGVGKATVSRGVARLEELLGAELVHRTTHQVDLSTAGLALFERAAPHVNALRSAAHGLPERQEEPAGELKVTAPNDFGIVVLADVLTQFAQRHPRVRLQVHLTNARVDLLAEGFDVALRVRGAGANDPRLTARRLGPATAGLYAAPSYLARRGKPHGFLEEGHDWLLHTSAVRAWKLSPKKIRFLLDDFLLARDLLRGGAGVGLLPSFAGEPYARQGLLERLALADAPVMQAQLELLYAAGRKPPPKVRAFRDALLGALGPAAAARRGS